MLGEDEEVQATVTLRPPGGIRVSGAALLRALAPFALEYGPGVIRRMLDVKRVYEALERRAAEGRPYWHVHMMAVHPELQGKGLGGRLLEEVLAGAVHGPERIVLTTHKAVNVRFYQRAGFRVTQEDSVSPAGAMPYVVWCMRRDPG
jgi:ribosomal protein S18 acetylase RimI-like enzyme